MNYAIFALVIVLVLVLSTFGVYSHAQTGERRGERDSTWFAAKMRQRAVDER